jgi:hypothetical protein
MITGFVFVLYFSFVESYEHLNISACCMIVVPYKDFIYNIYLQLLFKLFTLCTERERIQREKLRDLAVFERLNGNPSKSSPALAVKKVGSNLFSYVICD